MNFIEYCADFQAVIDGAIFVQFGVGSACICVVMFGFLVPSTKETLMFLVSYGMSMLLEIFVPAWLGTQLSYGSQELMVSAYKSEWLPRSKQYKSSIILFVERAKHPVVITGLKIFPLSLATYITIMRAAYSCFTMFRMILFLNRQDHAMH